MHYRYASRKDAQMLGELNHQLIQDEGHRNRMTVPELATRAETWLADGYRACIFEDDTAVLAYALYLEQKDHIYLRQFFVQRAHRRSGIGRQCIQRLLSEIWPKDKRIKVNVLCRNQSGTAFWRAMGFIDYCLTLEREPRDN
jgi:predicted acetyltransferase